jgi:hypothetical protein
VIKNYIFETKRINRLEKFFPTSSFVSKCFRQFLVELKKGLNERDKNYVWGKQHGK